MGQKVGNISVPGLCAWPRVSPAVRASWRAWDSASRRTPCSADGSCGEPRRMCGYAARCGKIRILNTRAKTRLNQIKSLKSYWTFKILTIHICWNVSPSSTLTYPPDFSLLRHTIEQRDNRDAARFGVCFPLWTEYSGSMENLPPNLAQGLPALRSTFSCPLSILWRGGSLRTLYTQDITDPYQFSPDSLYFKQIYSHCSEFGFKGTVSWDKIFFNIKKY